MTTESLRVEFADVLTKHAEAMAAGDTEGATKLLTDWQAAQDERLHVSLVRLVNEGDRGRGTYLLATDEEQEPQTLHLQVTPVEQEPRTITVQFADEPESS
jgi:hypothetical protein